MLSATPKVMGVINLSPDSFYAKSRAMSANAFDRAAKMVEEGADIIDIGCEATNPSVSLKPVDVASELSMLLPLIEKIKTHLNVRVSIDTSRPEVMIQAVASGADIINDQRALTVEGALQKVEHLKAQFVLMYMGPGPMAQVMAYLKARVEAAVAAGIPREALVLDPGFGGGHFGKTTQENLKLLKDLPQLTALGLPVLAGLSRKSFIGDILSKPVEARLYGSISAALYAVAQGAAIIRTHDVGATVDALNIWRAITSQ